MIQGIIGSLAVGLVILFTAGLTTTGSLAWMSWADLVIGALTFWLAIFFTHSLEKRMRIGAPVALGILLLAMWIIGLAAHAPARLSWWNFAFGLAFIASGLAARSESHRHPRLHLRSAV